MKFNLCAIGHLVYYKNMQKGFAFIWVLVGLLVTGVVLFAPIPKNSMCPASVDVDCPMQFGPSLFEKLITKRDSSSQAACTLEAKLCPDGSSVGREGLNCEFKKCPEQLNDSLSGWKTFKEKEYTFQLPQDWMKEPSVSGYEGVYQLSQFLNYSASQGNGQGKLKIEISIDEEKHTGSLASYIESKRVISQDTSFGVHTNIVVDGHQSIKVEKGYPGFIIYILNNKNNKVVSLYFGGDFDNYETLAGQILASFKFN
jgi:hypothetical protein